MYIIAIYKTNIITVTYINITHLQFEHSVHEHTRENTLETFKIMHNTTYELITN